MIATGGTVGLGEGIIDISCLNIVLKKFSKHSAMAKGGGKNFPEMTWFDERAMLKQSMAVWDSAKTKTRS